MMYVFLILGFLLLIKGADYFVEASSSVARALRIPSIIIGLTIVAFGTSAPELSVSISASIAGNNDIAVGNVIGSNLFNLLVVLGACGAIRPFAVKLRWDYAASAAVAVVLFAMILFDQTVGRVDGILLLVLFVAFVGLTVRDALVNRIVTTEEVKTLPPLRCAVYIVGGLAAIVWGGDLVVENASAIAASFGLSQNLIGLTIVASRKGENGLALGNVIGSNIFNILMVLGASAAIHPLLVNPFSVYDIGFLIIASAITWILCRSRNRISRMEGAFMLAMYLVYLIYVIVR